MEKSSINTSYSLGISFISALGGYLFGFDFAVIAGALPLLRDVFGLTAWWEGFLTGTLALGCMVGCVMAGRLADRYGRRPALMVAAAIFAVSSIAMAISDGLTTFMIARFVAGIGVGMASMLSPLYIAEVSPAEIRGRNVAINQLTIVIGILITNLINYGLADNGPDAWRLMFGLGAVPSILFFIGVIWLPESPRWLILQGQLQRGTAILERIGGRAFAESTVANVDAGSTDKSKVVLADLFKPGIRAAVFVGIGLAIFQQLCGINVVFNYTSTIFETVGANLDRQLFETVAIGFVNLVFTVVAMWQVDKLGRKPLMLFGAGGLTILYVIIALLLQNGASAGMLSIFVLLAIATYATSLAPVTWVLISEIFPNRVRGLASSVAILSLWGAYFILVFTFPILAETLGTYGPFWLYAVICLIGFFFVLRNVRETKGKTLEEMEDVFMPH